MSRAKWKGLVMLIVGFVVFGVGMWWHFRLVPALQPPSLSPQPFTWSWLRVVLTTLVSSCGMVISLYGVIYALTKRD